MKGISWVTDGFIVSPIDCTIINRYVLPLRINVKSVRDLNITVTNNQRLTLNAENIACPDLNLKIIDTQINIKQPQRKNLNIKP